MLISFHSESNEEESPAKNVAYPGGGKFAGKFSGKGVSSKFRGKGAAMFRGKAAQMMVRTPSSGEENDSEESER